MSKELSRFKLIQMLDIATRQLSIENKKALERVPFGRPPYLTDEKVYFKIGDNYKCINVNDIKYFFSKNKLTYARVGQRNFPTNVQLKIVEEELYPLFLRIHKTYIINQSKIGNIYPKDNNLDVIEDDNILPIGYAYRKSFFKELKILK